MHVWGSPIPCPGAPFLTRVGQGQDPLPHVLPCPLLCSVGPAYVLIMLSHLVGAVKCQKPQWDTRILFAPDRGSYDLNETLTLTCPEGYWSSSPEVACMKLNPRQRFLMPHIGWFVKNSMGHWKPVEGNMTCVGE